MKENESKLCRKCNTIKKLTEFKTSSTCKDGYRYTCKVCSNIRSNELIASRREEENLKRRKWVLDNPEKRKETSLKYRNSNKDKQKELRKKWRENNPERSRAQVSARRQRCRDATPSWADLTKIEHLYLEAQERTKSTGILHTVDHIIPLRGKIVSGLHVESNLQVLSYYENYSKSSKYNIDA